MNFALGYQLSVQGLADRLDCSIEDAGMHFNSFFAAYPSIAAWTKRTVSDSKVSGFTVSRLGRKHPIWAYESDKSWVYSGGERTAGNAPIQGGLADMMKLIMIRVDEALSVAGLKDTVRMVMNIHDALEFYVRKDVLPQRVVDVIYPAIVQQTPWTGHWPIMKPDWHVWERWGSPTSLKLDDDHQIMGMGEVLDIGVQEDDEDDEDAADVGVPAVLSAPAVPFGGSISQAAARLSDDRLEVDDSASSRDSSGPSVHVTHVGRVIVKVMDMPEVTALNRFMSLMAEFPGPNELKLDTPVGMVQVSAGTSLSPDDGARISLLLSGAQVFWAPETVDETKLADGLDF